MTLAIDMIGTSLGSGTRTYNLNFCNYLDKNVMKENIYIFITKDYLKDIKISKNSKIKFKVKSHIYTNVFFRIFWMQFLFPFELKRLKVTRLYSPMNMSPLILGILKIKLTLALHSNLPWVYFNMMPGNSIRNIITKYLMQFSVKLCDNLIVNSEFAKKEIIKILNLDPKKIFVIYLGIDKKFLFSDENKNLIPDFKYDNYIISVLSCVRYHNIINILKAFKLFKDKTKSKKKLTFIMQILDKDYFKEIEKFIINNDLKNEIIFFHNLNNIYLANLYKKASLYIFSSYCEVFGLTSLEAMSQGCPVLISNRSALPEINGQAAHYFNPDDYQEIYESVLTIFENNDYKNKLISNGNSHVKKFDWNKTVRETLNVLYS